MKKHALFCLPLVLLLLAPCAGLAAASRQKPQAAEEEWISLPAGGRPAYMGIQGGTMPVSLLVVGEGEALVTFVGRTGNDFLETLKTTDIPLPRLLNATGAQSSPLHAGAGSGLFAGNATASLPVIALSGDRLAGRADKLRPFGLSEQPLRIEGEISRPPALARPKNVRLSFLPAFLKPRR